MKKLLWSSVVAALLMSVSCNTAKQTSTAATGKVDFTIVQINDVYEIAPLEGGKVGGVARIATLKKQELAKDSNTMMIIAGDFLSPSVYNSLKFEGNRIRGKQMVEVLNTAGLDLAIFGNHEFDIPEADLQSRLDESAFKWVSSNTYTLKKGYVVPFTKYAPGSATLLPEIYIQRFANKNGAVAKIGFIGLTLPFNKASYVSYTDVFIAAQKYYNELKSYCDAVIAVTHQSMEDDIQLAKDLPGLALIIGGHEHERHYAKIGNVYITKADANAKSAYIIKLNLNTKNKRLRVKANIIDVNEKIPLDSATTVVVKKWTDIANKSYASLGFDATKVCMQTGEPLDGREAYIRAQQTNFTKLIVSAIEKASPTADVAIINSGSIRVDDIVQMPVTQYDVIRSLPFGGSILEVEMKGRLLIKILEASKKNVGSGGFLQYSPALSFSNDAWSINNKVIDGGQNYKVAITDFLMTGGEANLDFLTDKNPDLAKAPTVFTDVNDPRSDVRRAIIRYMESLGK